MPYIIQRWLGGTLTNFETIRKSVAEMDAIEAQAKSKEFESLTKKERKLAGDRLVKLESVFGGVREMKNLPDVVFVIDAKREELAITEAHRMNIPVVAMADTDANPDNIDYLIPANDDSTKSIELVLGEIKSMVGAKKVAKPVAAEKKEVKWAHSLLNCVKKPARV